MMWWRRKEEPKPAALWMWDDWTQRMLYNQTGVTGSYLWKHFHQLWPMTHPWMTP